MKKIFKKSTWCIGAALACALILTSCSKDDGVLPTLSTNAPAVIAYKSDGTGGLPFIEILTNQTSWNYTAAPADGGGWLTITKTGYLLVLKAAPNTANVQRGAVTITITAGDADPVAITVRQGVSSEMNITGITGDFVVTYTNGDRADMTVSGGKGMVDILDTNSPRTIYSMKSDATGEVFIGRKEDESITLKFASGAVVFRDAVDSKIPIGTYAELAMIDSVLDGNFVQDADIDLLGNVAAGVTKKNWQPLGWFPVAPAADKYFEGTYDGNGFAINNIYMYRTDIDNLGLFGWVNKDGVISNVAIASGEITGLRFIAGVVGTNNGLIEGCSNNATITGTFLVAGVCGFNDGAIEYCYNTGNIIGIEPLAGTYKVGHIGGVAGGNEEGGIMFYCYNTGTITETTEIGECIGGVAGWNYGDMDYCHNEGNVTGTDCVGGVAGLNGWSTVNKCYNKGGVIKGNQEVGGVAGYNDGIVSVCYNEGGSIDGYSYVGGVVGLNDVEMSECYNEGGAVLGYSIVGGLAGYNYDILYNCYNTGSVTANSLVGGINGYNVGDIWRCRNSGAVTGTQSYIGGVCGSNAEGDVYASYNTGTVSGYEYTGGVVGCNILEASVISSYNTASVSSTGLYTGGVCGSNEYESVTRACYSTGLITGTDAGGVIGHNGYPDEDGGYGYCYDCYWLKHTTGARFGIGHDVFTGESTDDYADPFGEFSWPETTMDGWGTGTGNGANRYWKVLTPNALGGWMAGGSPAGANSVFPKLYFE